MTNELATKEANLSLSGMLANENYKKRFNEILGKKAPGFMSSILSLYTSSTSLQKCDPKSILAAAAIAASLDLPILPSLGYAWIVPYAGKAQFQMGWKGYVQLALRTGQYAKIHSTEVYEGELVEFNRFTGDYVFSHAGKVSNKIIGYVSYFRLVNGFESYFYMSTEQVEAHALKYSQTYKSKNPEIKKSSKWTTDFDVMALKTVTKLNLAKGGILSIEMQTAIQTDQAIVNSKSDNVVEADLSYDDNPEESSKEKKELEAPEEIKESEQVRQQTGNQSDFIPSKTERSAICAGCGKEIIKGSDILTEIGTDKKFHAACILIK